MNGRQIAVLSLLALLAADHALADCRGPWGRGVFGGRSDDCRGPWSRDAIREPGAVAGLASMEDLTARVRADFPGHILKIELEREDDAPSGMTYEVKVLDDDGRVTEIEFDARSLEVLDMEHGEGWRHWFGRH